MTQPKPKFQHDCDNCDFMGTSDEHDLYVCPEVSSTRVVLVVRYGNEGQEYFSTEWDTKGPLPTNNAYYWEAASTYRESTPEKAQ